MQRKMFPKTYSLLYPMMSFSVQKLQIGVNFQVKSTKSTDHRLAEINICLIIFSIIISHKLQREALENQVNSSRIHDFSASSLSISSLSKIINPLSVFTFFGSDTFSSQRNSSNSQSQARPQSPIGLQWSLCRRPSAATGTDRV